MKNTSGIIRKAVTAASALLIMAGTTGCDSKVNITLQNKANPENPITITADISAPEADKIIESLGIENFESEDGIKFAESLISSIVNSESNGYTAEDILNKISETAASETEETPKLVYADIFAPVHLDAARTTPEYYKNAPVITEDGYYTVKFLKNKDFQNKINEDIRRVSDELYRYADNYDYAAEREMDESLHGVIMSADCKNGYLSLNFYYCNTDYEHITSLVYDIINEKEIRSFRELYTDNGESDSEFCRLFNDELHKSWDYELFNDVTVTPDNVDAFSLDILWLNDGSDLTSSYVSAYRIINNDEYSFNSRYLPNIRRDMTDYLDPAYESYHNMPGGK